MTPHYHFRQPLQAAVFLCLLILVTRKRVYIFLNADLICGVVLLNTVVCQLYGILSVGFDPPQIVVPVAMHQLCISHCRFNLLGDANSKAQPSQIERCNKGMTDSLMYGHKSPRRIWSASCSPYCSLGMRRKEAQQPAGLPIKIYCNRRINW